MLFIRPFGVLFSIYLFFPTIIVGEDWKLTVSKDNFIEISNFWNNELLDIDIIVSSSNNAAVYKASISVLNQEKKGAHFPYDFQLAQGDSINFSDEQEFKIQLVTKKNKLLTSSFVFQHETPAPFQLITYSYNTLELMKYDIWGTPVDAYTWDDKNGENLFIRSYIETTSQQDSSTQYVTYFYSYHFFKSLEQHEWVLFKKVTDKSFGCRQSLEEVTTANGLQLTDYNLDGIAEISALYLLSCNDADSVAKKRFIMLTDGEKFVATLSYNNKNQTPLISIESSKKDAFIERRIKTLFPLK